MKILIHSTTRDGEPLEADGIAVEGKNFAELVEIMKGQTPFTISAPITAPSIMPTICSAGLACLAMSRWTASYFSGWLIALLPTEPLTVEASARPCACVAAK